MKKNQSAEDTYFSLIPFIPKVFVSFLFSFLIVFLMLCGRPVRVFFLLSFCFYICDDIKENMKEQRISVTKKMRRTQLRIFLSVKVSDSFCSSFFFQYEFIFSCKLASKSVDWECCWSILNKYLYHFHCSMLIFLALQVMMHCLVHTSVPFCIIRVVSLRVQQETTIEEHTESR